MEFVLLAIPVIFGITSVYLANKAVQKGCKKKDTNKETADQYGKPQTVRQTHQNR